MLTFAWPWLALAAPLPLLVAWLAPPAAEPGPVALRLPFFERARAWEGASGRGRHGLRTWIAGLAWVCLVASACRPQWLGDMVTVPITGRDLLMCVDISGSMKTDDLTLAGRPASRLAVVKAVAGGFVERRRGDRIGLILFGSRAYLQAPLTFDRRTVRTLLEEAETGLAGEQTAIGDAIGLAVKRLRERPREQRVVVLLTDGANTAGEVAPVEAARVAAGEGLRIHTIGVGGEAGRGLLGSRRRGPASDIDEDALREVAARTGGRYFRARETAELEGIYALLDQVEPVAAGDDRLRPRTELFHWPLAGTMALAVAVLAAAAWRAPGPRGSAAGAGGRA